MLIVMLLRKYGVKHAKRGRQRPGALTCTFVSHKYWTNRGPDRAEPRTQLLVKRCGRSVATKGRKETSTDVDLSDSDYSLIIIIRVYFIIIFLNKCGRGCVDRLYSLLDDWTGVVFRLSRGRKPITPLNMLILFYKERVSSFNSHKEIWFEWRQKKANGSLGDNRERAL